MGAAFYAWDYGAKHGNLATLGALSYATPLLLTLLLLGVDLAAPSRWMALAGGCIVGGAALAALRPSERRSPGVRPAT